VSQELPEVIRLRDARGERPENAAGIGKFWYEPEVWTLPLSPDARVLYAGLCSFVGHGEINRKDLRNTMKDRPDREISSAIDELVLHDLLVPADGAGYEVRPVSEFR
jgi:preprotein translocase subunit Sec61beta